MPRKTYQRTDETFEVLSKNEAAIAREMECDSSYINKIKNGVEIDRFAFFRELFRAACYANAPVNVWLNDLTAIYTRAKIKSLSTSEISFELIAKFNADAETNGEIVKSLEDGHLDKAECHKILAALEAEKRTNAKIEQIVLRRLGELSEPAK